MASKKASADCITTPRDFRGELSPLLEDYDQQPELTGRLDKLGVTRTSNFTHLDLSPKSPAKCYVRWQRARHNDSR